MFTNGKEALADIGVDTGIDESDAPVAHVDSRLIFQSGGRRKIVRLESIVVEEIVFDGVALPAEAQDEFFVTPVGVILHHVQEDGAVVDVHQRFGNILSMLAEPHAESTAK